MFGEHFIILPKGTKVFMLFFHYSILLLPLDCRQEAVGFGPVVDVAGPQVISKKTKINQKSSESCLTAAFVSRKKQASPTGAIRGPQ